jgi:8-oxo-dGTP pyrophosphatase MutT (NUDIX family)
VFSPAEWALRLQGHQPSWETLSDTSGLVPAAVLIPLFFRAQEPWVLLTERTHRVSHHKGQIAFPGGKFEALRDPDLAATALRESEEEVGLKPRDVRVLGAMQPMPTFTGFHVHPFVAEIPAYYCFEPNPAEIETLIEVPLAHLQDTRFRRCEQRHWQGRDYPVYYFEYQRFTIWGITGHLLYDFLNVII